MGGGVAGQVGSPTIFHPLIVSLFVLFSPAGAGKEAVVFEAIPDFDADAPALKLCRIRIWDIGEGLPCVYFNNPKSKEEYSKSKEEAPYKDSGEIALSNLCPANYLNGDARQNKFLAQAIYEIPMLDEDNKPIAHPSCEN